MAFNRREFLYVSCAVLPACTLQPDTQSVPLSFYDPSSPQFNTLIDTSESLEVLGEGYQWSEGPTWDKKRNQLYFTDVPQNIAYVWNQSDGVTEFLNPSGGRETNGFREPGANGLLYQNSDELLLCNHGTRRLEMLDIQTKTRRVVADNFEGKKFNSPNDVIKSDKGDIYFTDPPYGLKGLDASPLKEQDQNGVYKVDQDGNVSLVISDLTFPNGVSLSPDQKTLYVSQSDPKAQHIYALDLTSETATKSLLVDLTPFSNAENPGYPDGMAIDVEGNIFATGPGGVFVISSNGDILGRILTGKGSANCAFGEDGSTLFITNHDRLVKVKTKTRGVSWT